MTVRVRTALVAATALALSAALAAPAIAAPPARPGGHDATRRAVEAAVEAGVPGVTVTARDGRGSWSATAGLGDIGTGEPRSPRDHYRVGSVAKTFVATVMLQLEAEGRLSLDDTVEQWLPGLVHGGGHDGSRITLRQLLNHTSGIYNFLSDPDFRGTRMSPEGFFQHRYHPLTPEDLVAIAMRHEPYFTPGTDWKYSNTNYVLASRVIEKATGRPYGTEIRRRIIEPLKLRNTSVPVTRVTVPSPSSRAYAKLAPTTTGPTYDVTEFHPSLAYGGGGVISDSADLNRFYRALLRGRLLPPEQLKAMKTTVTVPGRTNGRYGLGLIDRKLSCGVHVWGHGGDILGSLTEAVTTADGRHSLAFNFNGNWTGDTDKVIEAEFCAE
ncbi:serine hydrolase domain-containing protein [Streptomyces sp. S.PNR 29]|uniref:serine hydrolase domain-containing protein n=1 Tax=Streptomyces sp. S.PNR 29 TaxID=2973805 RepID=UPI0025B24E4F|nr:serine hydrolase domain-containing protein [Streptomyces sp. S.PNR 29]MDN0196858.1 beta-lactamase family protein [Streptomyces sp. S.PNR 29]